MELTTTQKVVIAVMAGYALGMAVATWAMWANRPRPLPEAGTVTKVPCAPCAEKRRAELARILADDDHHQVDGTGTEGDAA